MVNRMIVALVACLLVGNGYAGTYTVTTTANAGPGSLRWAIGQANLTGGGSICQILFAPALKGKTIKPVSEALPPITKAFIYVMGDIDGNGTPDVQLDGSLLWSPPWGGTQHGLTVTGASDCLITGLAIIGFPDDGILATNADGLELYSCHLGVDLAGATKRANRGYDLGLQAVGNGQITTNVFGSDSEVGMWDCTDCLVSNNYFGLKSDGSGAVGQAVVGLVLAPAQQGCKSNHVDTNVFAGVQTGIEVWGAGTESNAIRGNTFGLAADADTALPGMTYGIIVGGGARYNEIGLGGQGFGKGNVFAGASATGVVFGWAGTLDNVVAGNYFGTNGAGTRQRALLHGVVIDNKAGEQTIGGATATAGNLFVPSGPAGSPSGVECRTAGGSSVIRYNRFGVLPGGAAPGRAALGVLVQGVASVWVVDNNLVAPDTAIKVTGTGGAAIILRNRFRDCAFAAVRLLNEAHAALGDLRSELGEGRNVFRLSNLWDIRNETPNPVKAEGNDFDTTSAAAIDAKIWDKLDNAALGRVDYTPLIGGVAPTVAGGLAAVSVAGLAAVSTERGAEIVFTLSAPAAVTVTVLNLAGRVVAMPAQAVSLAAGTERVLWSGRTAAGTRAPGGRYLVRLIARDNGGRQATMLCFMSLP